MKKITHIESLEFKQVDFFYNPQDKVFDGMNFQFSKNEVLYLKGPRGSGKSTLMKLLLGLTTPISGDYLINGERVNEYGHEEFDQVRSKMGFSFDVGGLINNLTLYENFLLVLDYHNYKSRSDRAGYIVEMMKRFHLDEQKHLRPAFVSSSVRKAASLLRAFLLHPEVLILNDPTQGMSVEHIIPLVDLINEHKKNHNLKYVIISSDDVSLMEKLEGKSLNVTVKGLVELRSPSEKKGAA